MKKNWKIFIGVVVIGILVFGILFLNSTRKPPIGPGAQTPYSEISLTDSEVYEILKKFNFEISTQASIYKAGNFEVRYKDRPIPNDLILRMAWDNISMIEEPHREITEEKSTATVSQEAMEKSIYHLLGEITYKNQSFENIDCETFSGYNLNPGTIIYENGQYVADYIEGGGGSVPYLYEVAQNATKEGIDTIYLYVKTAFIDAFFNEDINDFTYNLYSDFDFDTEKFENQVISVSEKEFYQDIPQTVEAFQSIRLVDNHVFEQIKEKLNTYEYTFRKVSETEGYYLVGFQKI